MNVGCIANGVIVKHEGQIHECLRGGVHRMRHFIHIPICTYHDVIRQIYVFINNMGKINGGR